MAMGKPNSSPTDSGGENSHELQPWKASAPSPRTPLAAPGNILAHEPSEGSSSTSPSCDGQRDLAAAESSHQHGSVRLSNNGHHAHGNDHASYQSPQSTTDGIQSTHTSDHDDNEPVAFIRTPSHGSQNSEGRGEETEHDPRQGAAAIVDQRECRSSDENNCPRKWQSAIGWLMWMVFGWIDRHYFIIIVVGFGLNFAEWMCMLFLVFLIEHNGKLWYPLMAWVVIFPISFLVILALILRFLLPRRHSNRAAETAQDFQKVSSNQTSEQGSLLINHQPSGEHQFQGDNQPTRSFGDTLVRFLTRIASILVELLCFALVLLYFYRTAVPQYNSPIWDSEVEIHDNITLPAVMVIGNYNDAVSAKLDQHWLKAFFPEYRSDNSTSYAEYLDNSAQPLKTNRYGQVLFYDFNLPKNLRFTTESKEMLLQTRFTWNSSDIKAFYRIAAEYNPSLYVIVYDSQISSGDLSQAIDCGLLSWTEIPALGSNTLTMTVSRTSDFLGKIDTTRLNDTCGALARKLYSQKKPGYSTYLFDISSSGAVNGELCDVGPTGQAPPCITELLLRYQTFSVPILSSIPGIKKTDILISEGAIVGAVAFFLMFFAFFADSDPVLESFNPPWLKRSREAARSNPSVV